MAVAYGLLLGASGLMLGKNDSTRKYRGNLGLLYHGVVVIATSVGAITATLLSLLTLQDLLWGTVALFMSLALHYFGVKDDLKGIDKKDAFK